MISTPRPVDQSIEHNVIWTTPPKNDFISIHSLLTLCINIIRLTYCENASLSTASVNDLNQRRYSHTLATVSNYPPPLFTGPTTWVNRKALSEYCYHWVRVQGFRFDISLLPHRYCLITHTTLSYGCSRFHPTEYLWLVWLRLYSRDRSIAMLL